MPAKPDPNSQASRDSARRALKMGPTHPMHYKLKGAELTCGVPEPPVREQVEHRLHSVVNAAIKLWEERTGISVHSTRGFKS